MKMLEARLASEKYHTIWFNPWLYQSEDNLIVPLLQTIHDSLNDSASERFKESAKRIATVVSKIAASVFIKTATLAEVSREDIDNEIELITSKHAEGISAIRTLRNDLQSIVDDLTDKGQDSRLVLLVDDLIDVRRQKSLACWNRLS